MSFLMWPLLLGLTGTSIPVIIHLLHLQRTEPVLWGAMQFLRTSRLQMKRKRKVENWVLMAVRIMAIAALALALARPRAAKSTFLPPNLAGGEIDAAIVLDHSLSTGRLSNGQTIFDRGIALTEQAIDQLRPGSTLSVVLAEHRPRLLNTIPIKSSDGTALDQLRRQLRGLGQGMTDCSIPEAVAAARQVLARGRNADKLVVILSDQQRYNWHIKEDALWQAAVSDRGKSAAGNFSVYLLPIRPDDEFANVSISDISVQPKVLGIHRPMQIFATVSNTGTKPIGALSTTLTLNGKELESKSVAALTPKASATVQFEIERLTQAGSGWIKVSVNTADALAADNQAFAAFNVLQRLPVLIIDGQFSDAGSFAASRFLKSAMQPSDSSLVQAKVVSVAEASSTKLEDYAVVIANDVPSLPRGLRDRLVDYGRGGHGIWFILGPRTQSRMLTDDLPNGQFMTTDFSEVRGPLAGAVQVREPANGMVSVITANERNALVGAATRKWWSLKPVDPDAQVVLAAANGDPMVIERPYGSNGGKVAVWTTSVDGAWNNWHLMPNFVPLVNETIYYLSAPQMRGRENRGIPAGQAIEWSGPAKPTVESATVTLPDNTKVLRSATYNNGRWIVTYPDTYLPGIYRMDFAPREIEPAYYAVNVDRQELDPTILDGNDIDWLRRNRYLDPAHPTIAATDLQALLRRDNSATELWGVLGAVLLASLLIETILTYRLIGLQKSLDVVSAGLSVAHAK